MRTKTTDSTQSTTVTDLSPTTIFRLLTDSRRRYALHYLSRKVGAVPLDELAEQILLWEGDAGRNGRDSDRDRDDSHRNQFERVRADLYHCQLPRLTDAGVVAYDPERETVALRETGVRDQIAPYLRLSVAEDVQ